jgi:hypothetical protein
MEGIEGAIECHLKSGDALMFVDAIMHGSAERVNPDQRRMAVYRYGPSGGVCAIRSRSAKRCWRG